MRIGRFVGILILCSVMAASMANAGISGRSNEFAVLMEHYAGIEKIIKENGAGDEKQFVAYLNGSAERYFMDDLDSAKDLLGKALLLLQEKAKFLKSKPGNSINIKRWKGPGTKTSELFEIYGDEWILKWQGSAQPVKISIYKVDGSEMTLVDTFYDHQGLEHVYQGGVFCLKIASIYKWKVYVDVKN